MSGAKKIVNVKGATRVSTKFKQGQAKTAHTGAVHGAKAKKAVVLGIGGIALGVGAATSYASNFVKSLF